MKIYLYSAFITILLKFLLRFIQSHWPTQQRGLVEGGHHHKDLVLRSCRPAPCPCSWHLLHTSLDCQVGVTGAAQHAWQHWNTRGWNMVTSSNIVYLVITLLTIYHTALCRSGRSVVYNNLRQAGTKKIDNNSPRVYFWSFLKMERNIWLIFGPF